MRHYLDLIPISAKIHRRQNRRTIFCIMLSVLLIAGIFSMADFFIRSQILQAIKKAETGMLQSVILRMNRQS